MISIKVYRSLLFPVNIFGLPRPFAISVFLMGLTMVIGLGQVWFIVVPVILSFVGLFLGKEDAYFFDVYLQVIKLPKVAV